MEKSIEKKESALDLAAEWILNSGIQSEQGGFYAWYDPVQKAYPYIYSEITGYAITTLAFLYGTRKNNIFIRRAEKASAWLTDYALHPCGGVKTRLYDNDEAADRGYSFSGQNIFSFDTGMVLYGIINLYKITADKRLLEQSKRIAGFLIRRMQHKDGSIAAVYNAQKNSVLDPSYDKWSNQPGGFLAKVSLGLVELFFITKDNFYKDAVIKLCEYAVSTQDISGRFITDKLSATTHIHPHCYAAEGLIYAGRLLGIDKFINSAKSAAAWALEKVSAEGINELYDEKTGSFNSLRRSDIIAQVLRLGLIFKLDAEKIDCLYNILSRYQCSDYDKAQNGGFLYSKDSLHINSWCSMFAIQALWLYQRRKGASSENIQLII